MLIFDHEFMQVVEQIERCSCINCPRIDYGWSMYSKIKLKLEFLPICRMFLQMMGQSLLSCLVKWLR